MRRLLALALLAALSAPAAAAPITFTYTGSVQTYVVPTTGTYLLTAAGAQGGADTSGVGTGGLGAVVGGEFFLTAGTVLQVAVGGAGLGDTGEAGGGGGTFLVAPGDVPVLVAGGGAGGGLNVGGAGQAAAFGTGLGGAAPNSSFGSGGGGFLGDGADDTPFSTGGRSWLNGLAGGSPHGGFGGGGGAATGMASGGGGGYSGGNGGVTPTGGSSFWAAGVANPTGTSGARSGNGFASIELLSAAAPVPEPATLATLGLLAGVGGLVARRRKTA